MTGEGNAYAFCINCEEIVAIVETEKHSRECVEVRSEVVDTGCVMVYSGVQKIITFLEVELKRRKSNWPHGCYLLKIANDLLYSDTLEITEEIDVSLASNRISFSESPPLDLILFQRLSVLTTELLRYFQSQAVKTVTPNAARQRESFKGIEAEIERYKEKVQMYHSFLTMREKYSESVLSADLDSEMSEPTYFFTNEDEEELGDKEKISAICSESLREYFYTQCIAQKLHHKKASKAQKVPIDALYQHAIESQIPVEAWPTFIRSQLQRPHTWTQKLNTVAVAIPEELDRSFD